MSARLLDTYCEACDRRLFDAQVIHKLSLPARAPTTNAIARMHRMEAMRVTREWRQWAWAAAKQAKVGRHDKIAVTVQSRLRGKRSRDVASEQTVAKACVDGLADAGVIVNDTPDHLLRLSFEAPVLGAERDELVLWVEVWE